MQTRHCGHIPAHYILINHLVDYRFFFIWIKSRLGTNFRSARIELQNESMLFVLFFIDTADGNKQVVHSCKHVSKNKLYN